MAYNTIIMYSKRTGMETGLLGLRGIGLLNKLNL